MWHKHTYETSVHKPAKVSDDKHELDSSERTGITFERNPTPWKWKSTFVTVTHTGFNHLILPHPPINSWIHRTLKETLWVYCDLWGRWSTFSHLSSWEWDEKREGEKLTGRCDEMKILIHSSNSRWMEEWNENLTFETGKYSESSCDGKRFKYTWMRY